MVIVHGVKGNTFLEAATGFFGGGFVDIRHCQSEVGLGDFDTISSCSVGVMR